MEIPFRTDFLSGNAVSDRFPQGGSVQTQFRLEQESGWVVASFWSKQPCRNRAVQSDSQPPHARARAHALFSDAGAREDVAGEDVAES